MLFKTSFQNMSDGVCELSRIKGAGWLCTKPINGWIKCGQNTFKGQKIMRIVPQRKSVMRPMLNRYFGNAPLKI